MDQLVVIFLLHRIVKADCERSPEAVVDGNDHDDIVPVFSEHASLFDNVPTMASRILRLTLLLLNKFGDELFPS